ncbi:MAG: hypothetical protein JWS12_109 [Candidatus Saccharibacteria bacterium]|nr:hypothetical protein [Candidatus Saccharibacteria bacterium]
MSDQDPTSQLPSQLSPEFSEIVGNIEVFRRPIAELPEVGDDVILGQEFWSRAALIPGEEGPNYNNMPAFGFGIHYKGEEAVLTVPSLDYVNQFVDTHNPGGFHFEDSSNGNLDGEEFLRITAQKKFLVSQDRSKPFKVYDAATRCLKHGSDVYIIVTDYYEHDRTDHLGLSAIEGSEAQKVVSLVEALLETDYIKTNDTKALDALLSSLSDYALLPSRPVTEFDKEAKVTVRDIIQSLIRSFAGNLAILKFGPSLELDSLKEHTNEIAKDYLLDFDVIDQKIAELQALPAPPFS